MVYENLKEKILASKMAVQLVKDGSNIGIGGGSTILEFAKQLKQEIIKKQLNISCTFASKASEDILKDLVKTKKTHLDIMFDGADSFDPQSFNMIKGKKGALLKEKILSLKSNYHVAIVDNSKISTPLVGPVPVEIVSFGYLDTIQRIKQLGLGCTLNGKSESNNYLCMVHYKNPINNPLKAHLSIKQITGVIETGFFVEVADLVIVAKGNNVQKLTK